MNENEIAVENLRAMPGSMGPAEETTQVGEFSANGTTQCVPPSAPSSPLSCPALVFMSSLRGSKFKRKKCRKCGHKWYSRVVKPRCCPNCKRADWKTDILSGKRLEEKKAEYLLRKRRQMKATYAVKILRAGGLDFSMGTFMAMLEHKPELNLTDLAHDAVAEQPKDLFRWMMCEAGLAGKNS